MAGGQQSPRSIGQLDRRMAEVGQPEPGSLMDKTSQGACWMPAGKDKEVES